MSDFQSGDNYCILTQTFANGCLFNNHKHNFFPKLKGEICHIFIELNHKTIMTGYHRLKKHAQLKY